LLSAAEGAVAACGPETGLRAGVRPAVLRETVLDPPSFGRREPEKALIDGWVYNFPPD